MIWIILPIAVGVFCFLLALQFINTLRLVPSKKKCPECGGRNIKVRARRKAGKYYWSGGALYLFKKEGVCQDCHAVFGILTRSDVDRKWRNAGIRLQVAIIVTAIVIVVSFVVPRVTSDDTAADTTVETTEVQ